MACKPSHSIKFVQPTGPCVQTCAGVTFTINQIREGVDADGNCSWFYAVTRNPDGAEFSDTVTLSCPDSKVVTLYCDAAETCAYLEITLTCEKGD